MQLQEACRLGDTKIVAQLLIEKKADINGQDQLGNTALHNAFYFKKPEIIEQLIEYPQIKVNIQNCMRMSPLHYSVIFSYEVTLLRRLLELKAEVNLQDEEGRTPSHLALMYNKQAIWTLLESRRVDIYVKDNTGKSLLQYTHAANDKYLIQEIKFKAGPSKADALSILLGTKQLKSSVYQFRQSELYDKQLWRVIFNYAGVPKTPSLPKDNGFTMAYLLSKLGAFLNPFKSNAMKKEENNKNQDGIVSKIP
jgi:Ankyrin repeats (3 copies)